MKTIIEYIGWFAVCVVGACVLLGMFILRCVSWCFGRQFFYERNKPKPSINPTALRFLNKL